MTNKTFRVEISTARVRRMKTLAQVCRLKDIRELMDNALTLFDAAVKEKRKGRSIGSFNSKTGTFRAWDMLALSRVKARPVRRS